MRIVDNRGDRWVVCLPFGASLAHQVEYDACLMTLERGTRAVRVIMSRDEYMRAHDQGGVRPRGSKWDPFGSSIAGLPITEEVGHTFPVQGEPLLEGEIGRMLAWRMALDIVGGTDPRDEVYRKHGGTKRPPSKLHPLVQLDEAIGRNMEKGDQLEPSEPTTAAPACLDGPSSR